MWPLCEIRPRLCEGSSYVALAGRFQQGASLGFRPGIAEPESSTCGGKMVRGSARLTQKCEALSGGVGGIFELMVTANSQRFAPVHTQTAGTARPPLSVLIYSFVHAYCLSPVKPWHAGTQSTISQNIIHLDGLLLAFQNVSQIR